MCGIAGFLSLNHTCSVDVTAVIYKMADAMAHRGPDAEGFYIQGEVALGHRRLSIIDLSGSANQPFTDTTGRYNIIFNGEIFNFREIKKELDQYAFRTSGDTEVILAAYEKWGTDCLQKLKGFFSIAIWDAVEKTLFIARDRMGVKPIYFFINDAYLLFASEIRSLLQSGLVPKKLNRAAIREFLSYQSIGFPVSPIDNINQLEAGSYLFVKDKKITVKKYWDITCTKHNVDFNDIHSVHTHVRVLLRDAVEKRLISDVPLGAFLSGGIDSSAIVGLMAEVSNERPVTFTIGFTDKEFDESDYADIIAKKFNTRHNRVLLQPDTFLQELTNALDAMDTPSGDGINTYVVSKAIRQSGLTVAISGVGGDELFAGYPFFKKYLQLRKYNPVWNGSKWLRKSAAMLMSSSGKGARIKQILNAPANHVRYFYPEFRRIVAPDLLQQLTCFSANQGSTLLEQQLDKVAESIETFPQLSQVSIAEYLGYTQHTLLKDTDQMSMAVSLEVREPFFDHELVEYVLGIPDVIKIPVYPKKLLIESLNGLLPDEIVHRKKQGFLFPWSVWMKKELHSFCENHLQQAAQRDFINGDQVLKYWKRFLRNDPSVRWMEIWLFVVLEYWMQKNAIE